MKIETPVMGEAGLDKLSKRMMDRDAVFTLTEYCVILFAFRGNCSSWTFSDIPTWVDKMGLVPQYENGVAGYPIRVWDALYEVAYKDDCWEKGRDPPPYESMLEEITKVVRSYKVLKKNA